MLTIIEDKGRRCWATCSTILTDLVSRSSETGSETCKLFSSIPLATIRNASNRCRVSFVIRGVVFGTGLGSGAGGAVDSIGTGVGKGFLNRRRDCDLRRFWFADEGGGEELPVAFGKPLAVDRKAQHQNRLPEPNRNPMIEPCLKMKKPGPQAIDPSADVLRLL